MKRGQVATFVILGLVILTTVVTIYTFRAQILEATFGTEVSSALIVPPQAEKVKLFVDQCIEQSTQSALGTLGLQGGYVELPEQKIPPNGIYPFSNTFDIFGDKGVEVPLWFFEDAQGAEQEQVPSIKDMEIELAEYIDEYLPLCLNNFQSFKQQGYVISSSFPSTSVTLGDKAVIVDVNFPLDIRLKEFTFSFDTFKRNFDSALVELYNVAREVMLYENENYFVENSVLDMMVVYGEIPFSGVDFDCSPESWTKTDVYNDLKHIMASNLPSLRIEGTTYTPGNEAKSFVIDALRRSHDLSVRFRFDESWPLLMEVIGEPQEVLRGKPFTLENDASRFLLPLFCLNDYHFVYNLKFPVVITLEKNGEIFRFGTLGVIQNNQPRENRVSISSFDSETPICEYPSKDMVLVAEGYKKNGVVQPLANARMSFKCLNQVCELGSTRIEGSSYALTSKVPSCFNGLLIAEAPGFLRGEQLISTNQDIAEATVTLEPLQPLAVEILVDDEGAIRSLYSSEQVFFTFTNKEKGYTTSIVYPGQKVVQLVAGEYEVTSSLIIENNKGFKLKSKDIEVCNDVPKKGLLGIAGLKEKKCFQHTIGSSTLKQIPVGGTSVNWFAERDQLLNAQKITLHTFRGPTPQSLDEITKVFESLGSKEVNPPVLQ